MQNGLPVAEEGQEEENGRHGLCSTKMILLTAEGETRRRGKSGGTGAKSGDNRGTLRHPENGV